MSICRSLGMTFRITYGMLKVTCARISVTNPNSIWRPIDFTQTKSSISETPMMISGLMTGI